MSETAPVHLMVPSLPGYSLPSQGFKHAADRGSGGLREWAVREIMPDTEIQQRIIAHCALYTTVKYHVIAVEAMSLRSFGPPCPVSGRGTAYLSMLTTAQAVQVGPNFDYHGWSFRYLIPRAWWLRSPTGGKAGQFLITDTEDIIAARQCEQGDHGVGGSRVLTLAEFLGLGYRYNAGARYRGLRAAAQDIVAANSRSLRRLLDSTPSPARVG